MVVGLDGVGDGAYRGGALRGVDEREVGGEGCGLRRRAGGAGVGGAEGEEGGDEGGFCEGGGGEGGAVCCVGVGEGGGWGLGGHFGGC